MSIKSLAQVIILMIIFSIIGSVYFIYFKGNDEVQNEVINTNNAVEKEINNSEINKRLSNEKKLFILFLQRCLGVDMMALHIRPCKKLII